MKDLAKNHSIFIFAQTNVSSNVTAGTLISIPKQYTLEEPRAIFYEHHDRYTFVSLVNEKGTKIILGAIYIRPALTLDSASNLMILRKF